MDVLCVHCAHMWRDENNDGQKKLRKKVQMGNVQIVSFLCKNSLILHALF